MKPGPPSLWYRLLVVSLWHYRSQVHASVVTCWFFQASVSGNREWTFCPRQRVYGTCPISVRPLGCDLVSSVSKFRRAELGIDTPSRYLAETARTPVIIIIIIKWSQTGPWWGTTSYTSTGCHNWTSSLRFPQEMLVENPQLATDKWSSQKYGKHNQVWPRSDPGQTWSRLKPMTASLNEKMPSYPYQALPAPSMATDNCGKHRCSIIDWNSRLKRCPTDSKTW